MPTAAELVGTVFQTWYAIDVFLVCFFYTTTVRVSND